MFEDKLFYYIDLDDQISEWFSTISVKIKPQIIFLLCVTLESWNALCTSLTECRKVLCYFLHFWQVNSYFLHCFVLGLFFSHISHNLFSTAMLKSFPLLLLIITCKGHLYVVCYLFLTAKVNSNKPGLLTTYVTMPG